MFQWSTWYGEKPRNGQSTPWGKSDSITKIAPGIAFLTTPSHGGYRVSKALAENEIPRIQLDRCAIFDGRYYWFEEDCSWAIVAINFPQYFEHRPEAQGVAFKTIRHFFPGLVS